MKTLKFTTCAPQMFAATDLATIKTSLPENPGTEGSFDELPLQRAYIHGEAMDVAGYDIPIFYAGNAEQLSMPWNKQDIVMVLDGVEHAMVGIPQSKEEAYYLVFKGSEDAEKLITELRDRDIAVLQDAINSDDFQSKARTALIKKRDRL